MEIILQKDIKNLGKAGDRVRVRPGYARNYLLPKKLALTLDETRLGEWKHKQQVIEARKKRAASERDLLLKKLSAVHLTFERESRAGGHLFGSVSPVDISRELEEQQGLLVDKRDITTEPLKTEGEHQVKIALDSERQTEIKVIIKKILSEQDTQKKAGGASPEKEGSEKLEKQRAKDPVKDEDRKTVAERADSQKPAPDQISDSKDVNTTSEDNSDQN